ncbi:MAG: hypothetical protein GF308_08150 [Candidatus Heimdallarchaeota archaeon]|nr:hypothetical protein [Candidatus Heimdallarchaeota archaeon]
MILQQESEPVRTAVTVRNQLVTLPEWLVEGASSRCLSKGLGLAETKERIIGFHVVDKAYAKVEGSRGDEYTVVINAFDEGQLNPPKMHCNCPHGQFGWSGICYHKIAVILLYLVEVKNMTQMYCDVCKRPLDFIPDGSKEEVATICQDCEQREQERIAQEKREEIEDIFGGVDW